MQSLKYMLTGDNESEIVNIKVLAEMKTFVFNASDKSLYSIYWNGC